MNKEHTDLNKSVNDLIDSFFSEDVVKADNLDVASASKTTADAAISGAPGMQDDAARGAGRPKQISDVPKTDEDGSRGGNYDASITSALSEDENEEAKKQSKESNQLTSAGRIGAGPTMKDPRLSKSISDEEYAEFQAFKKAQAERTELKKAEDLKKSEDLKKAELETLVKSAVASAIAPIQKENQELKKTLTESETLIKAMASQPQRSKSVTGIHALEKSTREDSGAQEFNKKDKLDAAERLVMKKSLPMDAVIELENTGTVYRTDWQQLIEAELQKNN